MAAVVLGVGILAAFVLAAFVLADVRDRRKVPPVPRRVLERYDDDGTML